jgi:hypothetical protein
MALEEYVGAISLEVDGKEVEVSTFNVKQVTGRRPIKTMNRAMRVKGFSRGIVSFDLSVTAVIPLKSTPVDWANIEGAKITVQPVGGGKRTSYLDAFTTEVGEKYEVEGEAVIDLSMIALRKVTE